MIILGTVVSITLIMACGGVSLLSIKSTITDMEGLIESQYIANKETFNSMWNSIVKKAHVTELQAEKFKGEFREFILGKDGKSETLLNSLLEQNPQLTSSLVSELQRVIALAKKNCTNNQIAISERISEYNEFIIKHALTNRLLKRTALEIEFQF